MNRILTGAALALGTAIAVVPGPAAQAATNIGFDAHAPGFVVSIEPGLPLSPASQQNAVRAAKQYLDYTAFSHAGLIDQLEHDGYTSVQAEYGVTAAGL